MARFVKDTGNNIGRGCAVMGSPGGREWIVIRAVEGDRYMIRNYLTGTYMTVETRLLTNLY